MDDECGKWPIDHSVDFCFQLSFSSDSLFFISRREVRRPFVRNDQTNIVLAPGVNRVASVWTCPAPFLSLQLNSENWCNRCSLLLFPVLLVCLPALFFLPASRCFWIICSLESTESVRHFRTKANLIRMQNSWFQTDRQIENRQTTRRTDQ